METKTYWVGDRPAGAWIFTVLDQKTGAPFSLGQYQGARVILVGSDNEQLLFDGQNTAITDPPNGQVTFLWPTETLFTKAGRYQLQLELYGPSTSRRTTIQDILVREIGGVTR